MHQCWVIKSTNFVLQFISREKKNIVRYLYLSPKTRAVDVDIVTISPFFYYICIFVLMKIIGLYKSVLWNIGYLSIAWVEYWTLTKFDFYRHKFTSRSSIWSYWVPPMVCAVCTRGWTLKRRRKAFTPSIKTPVGACLARSHHGQGKYLVHILQIFSCELLP